MSLQLLRKKEQSDTKFIKEDIPTKATLQFSRKEKETMNLGIFIM
ncbi:Hypothetical Protein U712_06160 [Bacillus subtilis PY79]|nr:Hypothetical Protein U712_06160 [Bacillus subtilis PY79]AKE23049.1 hypothetical protein BsLM_1250 [Bacillus sp. LM 4-2]EME06774.1 hypothetical protein BS732_1939 [Bacillus subtilis MB73/2]